MDEFTESLLERTRARSENLAKKMNQSQVSPRKRRNPLTDVNSPDNGEKKGRLESSPVKSALRGSDVKPDTPAIPSIRSRMSKLSEMRKEWATAEGSELDSPKNVPAPRPRQPEPEPSATSSVPSTRKGRFAALAATINSWEDDLDHPRHEYRHEEKPQTRKWERPKPVEEPSEDRPQPKKDTSTVSTSSQRQTPKKPLRNVRFQDEEEQKDLAGGNGQGKAQMRSLPAGSPARNAINRADQKMEKPEAKAELRSLPTGSPARSTSAYSRLMEKKVDTEKSSTNASKGVVSSLKNEGPQQAEFRSIPGGGSPARKRIQVSLSREREPSRMELQKHFAQEQQQPTPKPRAAPTATTSTTQPKASTKRQAPQPPEAVKKQAVESSKGDNKPVTAGNTNVKAYFGRHKAQAPQPPSSPSKVEPRVSAMAKSIQERLRQHQENWQSNEINKKVQEQRQKELDIIKQRWNYSNKADSTEKSKEQDKPTPTPRVTISRSVPEPESEEEDMEVTEDTINVGMMESPPPQSSSEEEEEEETVEKEEIIAPRKEAATKAPSQIAEEKGAVTPLPLPREKAVAKTSKEQEEEKGPATPLAPPRPRRTNSKQLAEEEAKAKQEAVAKRPGPEQTQQDSESDADADDEDEDDIEEMNITDVFGDIDDLLNEAEHAMEAEQVAEKSENTASTQKQMQVASQGSSAQKPPSGSVARPQPTAPQSPNLYSIESFRKQGPKSPAAMRTIIRSDSGTVAAGQGVKPQALKPIPIKEQIQTLMEEVSAQQSVIYQTSQALNLIASNAEYKGSRQEVEAERLLLIAAQRRQACLAEIQRLKTPAAVREPNTMQTSDGEIMKPCKGFVTVKDIRLPLKTEYVLSVKQDRMCHYFFLLLRCREHVLATRIQTTVDGVAGDCLPFTNIAKFNNLDSDFVIEVFVFEMQNKRPKTEDKNKQTFFSGLTPKKILANISKDSRQGAKLPTAPSPGGPGAVRASSFTLVGATRLSLQSSRVSRFSLSKVPFNSPLEGSVHLQMTCHTNTTVTESGWLTMFDDISGFGAWHRRWCVLSGGYISYWRYPDDEKLKAPNGTINLRQCITPEVAPISRILCARPNTFELVTRQPASTAVHHSKDTLVTKHEDSAITTKHMLSADIKEDRIRWIDALNKTLLDLRTWNRDATRPGCS